jgi:hypothetical protein
VLDLTFNPYNGQLITYGNDKYEFLLKYWFSLTYKLNFNNRTIAIWDITTTREVHRISTSNVLANIEPFPHPHASRYMLACRKDHGQLLLLDGSQSSYTKEDMVEVLDLNFVLNPAKKEKCKIYSLVAHPLQQYTVVCCTNRGTCVVRIGGHP